MASPFLHLSLATVLWSFAAPAQCEPQWLPGDPIANVSGSVDDSTTWDPDGAGPAAPLLIAVGRIAGGQVYGGPVAAWDGSQWLRLGTPPVGDGRSVVVWNGNLVVSFAVPGNLVKVASWNGTDWQHLGTFGATTYAPYAALAVHQGDLYAGGNFNQVDGVPAPYVVRWTGSAWSAVGNGPPGRVGRMVSFQNVLYASCSASVSPGGQLATWNGTAWTVVATCSDSIEAMAVRTSVSLLNSFLYVGGRFAQWTGVNGTVAGPIVRYNPSANAWTGLGFTASTVVRDLALRSTGLTSFEAVAVDYNGLWQQSGTSWVQLGTPVPNSTSATYYNAAWHLMTYSASAPGNETAQRLQAGVWVPLTQSVTSLGQVRAARAEGNDTIVGGNFGLRRGQPGAWNPVGGLTGNVDEIARLANGDLVVAGIVAAPGWAGLLRSIARWNGTSWSSLTSSLNGPVHALLPMPDGGLIAGGSFTSIDGVSTPYIARWNGSTWQSLAGGFNDVVHALTRLPNGDVVAGGDFTLAGTLGNIAPYAARWDGFGWTAMTAPSPVFSLTTEAGGSVVGLMDQARRWTAGAWQPLLATNADAVIALPGGDLCFAGDGSVRRTSATGVLRTLASCYGTVRDLVLAEDGDVLVAGDIQGVAGVASVGVARLDAPCPATSLTAGPGCTGSAGPLVLTPTALPWLGTTFRAVATGLPNPALGVVVTGLAPTSLPLLAVFPVAGAGCTLHVQPDLLEVAFAAGGAVAVQLAVPNAPALIGTAVHHQVVSLRVDAALNFLEVTATNALLSTVGTL